MSFEELPKEIEYLIYHYVDSMNRGTLTISHNMFNELPEVVLYWRLVRCIHNEDKKKHKHSHLVKIMLAYHFFAEGIEEMLSITATQPY